MTCGTTQHLNRTFKELRFPLLEDYTSSTSLSNSCVDKYEVNSPRNVRQDSANVNQTNAVATTPTSPWSFSCVTDLAIETVAADAMCCHNADTSKNAMERPDAMTHAGNTFRLDTGVRSTSERLTLMGTLRSEPV